MQTTLFKAIFAGLTARAFDAKMLAAVGKQPPSTATGSEHLTIIPNF
jgi:hypothetical protein